MSKSAKSPLKSRLGLSLGHVANDLQASFWISYSLLALKLHLPAKFAGLLVSLGQAVDATTTLSIGYCSTRRSFGFVEKYGKLKFFHLIGSILVVTTFPFMFGKCLGCEQSSNWTKFAYFFFFVTLSQVGWASAQVSHIALIIKMSRSSAERVTLNSYRQAATVASSIIGYAITFALLSSRGNAETLTRADLSTFTISTLILSAVGVFFTALFHLLVSENGTEEEVLESRCTSRDSGLDSGLDSDVASEVSVESFAEETKGKKWQEWFKESMFYRVCVLYVIANLYYMLMQMYMPLFLQHTLKSPKESVALVPFVTYSAGFISSFVIKRIADRFGSKAVLFQGLTFAIAFGVWIYFADEQFGRSWQVYVASAFNGISGTSLLISIFSLIGDLTTDNPASGAFVFGVIGFTDKITNGLAVLLLEISLPEPVAGSDNSFYKTTLLSVIGGCATILLTISLSLIGKSKGRSNEPPEDLSTTL